MICVLDMLKISSVFLIQPLFVLPLLFSKLIIHISHFEKLFTLVVYLNKAINMVIDQGESGAREAWQREH